MKIIKHARENPFESVSGPLLGLVVNHTLQITNCFPFPEPAVDGESEMDGLSKQARETEKKETKT